MLARISKAGLISMAMLVAVLWACILGESLIVRRANREYAQTMLQWREMRMKKQAQPVSLPTAPHRARPSIG